jgi:hypothetical protein
MCLDVKIYVTVYFITRNYSKFLLNSKKYSTIKIRWKPGKHFMFKNFLMSD